MTKSLNNSLDKSIWLGKKSRGCLRDKKLNTSFDPTSVKEPIMILTKVQKIKKTTKAIGLFCVYSALHML